MIQRIENEIISWTCKGHDVIFCEQLNISPVQETYYCLTEAQESRGATIVLPNCIICGTQTFLKADYTFRELVNLIHPVLNNGVIWSYALPLRHVRNICLHQWLWEQGRAKYAPIIPMPTRDILGHPHFASTGSSEVVLALWFGFSLLRGHTIAIEGQSDLISQIQIIGG